MRTRGRLGAAVALAFLVAPAGAAANSDYIVVLKDQGASGSSAANDHARRFGVQPREVYGDALQGYAATLSNLQLAEVRSDPNVQFVEPDRGMQLAGQTVPTGAGRIGAGLSSALSGNGAGSVPAKVAVIDIGVDSGHPDLSVKGGKDCSAPGTPYNPWHGTAVAGAISARDNSYGSVGTAPGATIYPARITNYWMTQPGAPVTTSSVICAVNWVTSTRRDRKSDNDIQVANMSVIGDGADDGNCGNANGDALHKAICSSVTAGVTYVVAAGNGSADFRNQVPASYDEVLTVTGISDGDGQLGATGVNPSCTSSTVPEADDTPAAFSNWATLPGDQGHTVAAPAVCIFSTAVGGGYDSFTGTSLAAPEVTGTVALCITSGRCAGLSPPQIVQKLRGDAEAYSTAHPEYGFAGDPLHAVEGRYYGYLVRTAGY